MTSNIGTDRILHAFFQIKYSKNGIILISIRKMKVFLLSLVINSEKEICDLEVVCYLLSKLKFF